MNKNIFKSREGRGRLFAIITVSAIAVLFVLNLLLTYFGIHKTLFLDMTPEGFYTLTDAMKTECEYIEDLDGEVKVTFCADPDTLIASENTRVVYYMATQLDNLYDNFEVETVNVNYNPTAVAKYKATSMTKIESDDVIVSYGDRYRILAADSFWTSLDGELWSFNGEYRLASIIKSVTAKDRPAAYFVTGHGESYYDVNNRESAASLKTEEFYNLLVDRCLEVKTLDLSSVSEIPDDCVLLIINDPREDYTSENAEGDKFGYVSETEKIDRYLVKDHGSVMVSVDYSIAAAELPILSSFLYEWGFDLSDSRVTDGATSIDTEDTVFVGAYDESDSSYGYAIYGDYASLPSAPEVMMSNTGYITTSFGTGTSIPESGTYSVSRNYAPFLFSSDMAEAHRFVSEEEGFADLDRENEKLTLVAVTTRLEVDSYKAEYSYSYVMCANSPDFFASEFIGNPSYANYDVISALTENMVRTDEYASIELGGTSLNSPNLGGKPYVDTDLYATDDTTAETDYKLISNTAKGWFVALVMTPALCVAVLGIVVAIKRKFL